MMMMTSNLAALLVDTAIVLCDVNMPVSSPAFVITALAQRESVYRLAGLCGFVYVISNRKNCQALIGERLSTISSRIIGYTVCIV